MNNEILRGDIYFADLDRGVGSEQKGYRPVLVIQNNIGNHFSPTIIIAAITGKVQEKTMLPTHCVLKDSEGLNLSSMVLGEQLATIDKRRLKRYVGRVDGQIMQEVDRALAISIGLSIVY